MSAVKPGARMPLVLMRRTLLLSRLRGGRRAAVGGRAARVPGVGAAAPAKERIWAARRSVRGAQRRRKIAWAGRSAGEAHVLRMVRLRHSSTARLLLSFHIVCAARDAARASSAPPIVACREMRFRAVKVSKRYLFITLIIKCVSTSPVLF